MTDKQAEALKLALATLEYMYSAAHDVAEPAITAIKQALADHIGDVNKMVEQPAQQPHCDDCGGFDPKCPLAQPAQQQEPKPKFVRNVDGVPCITLVEHEHLMRSRPQPSKPWVGLTDEEFAAMWMQSNIYGTNREKAIALGRAIEAKLREKNA